MPGKGKVHFVRAEDFESIEEELSVALDRLDEANSRIVSLLDTETIVEEEELPLSETEDGDVAESEPEAEEKPPIPASPDSE